MKKLFLILFAVGSMALTGCLHIVEEVSFNKSGAGTYQLTLDMSELKGMMDMMKNMAPDSSATDSTGLGDMMGGGALPDNSMSQLGEELTGVAKSLKGIPGISNIQEMNDTTELKFGYSFDFTNVEALNKAMKIINKEKYDAKAEEVFKYDGKNFERLGAGDMGAELKKALSESGAGGEEEEGAEGMGDMMKMFFSDMSYKQIYRFSDRTIKKSSNEQSEIGDEGHTLTISLKPFDEEQQKKKITVATVVKLK